MIALYSQFPFNISMKRLDVEEKARVILSGVPVFCRYDEIRKVADLKENPDNPNRHPDTQIERLAEVIRLAGWRAPITVSDLSGMIVKGHGRLAAAKLAGLEEVPVEIQHYETPEHERADLIADNHIAELADLDDDALKLLIRQMSESGEFPLTLTGFSDREIDDMLNESPEDIPEDLNLERDEAGSTSQNFVKFGTIKIILSEEEARRFKEFYDRYLNDNGNVMGIFTELLNKGDKRYAN